MMPTHPDIAYLEATHDTEQLWQLHTHEGSLEAGDALTRIERGRHEAAVRIGQRIAAGRASARARKAASHG